MYNYKKWRDLTTIGCVKKTITNLNTDKITTETRYYISNLPANILEFSNAKTWGFKSFKGISNIVYVLQE